MKRILPAITALLLVFLLLTACGGSGKQPLPAPDDLAKKLLDAGIFSEALEAADGDIAAYLYGLTDAQGVELRSWMSSGATAEELTIFTCQDDAVLQEVRKSVDARLEMQKSTFSNYVPAEVPKLENAVIRVRDRVLIVCVSADGDKAAKLLSPYFPA
jgi:predicted small lipoprotein YifL